MSSSFCNALRRWFIAIANRTPLCTSKAIEHTLSNIEVTKLKSDGGKAFIEPIPLTLKFSST